MIKDYDKHLAKIKSVEAFKQETERVLLNGGYKKCIHCGKWFSSEERGIASNSCKDCHKKHFGKEDAEDVD